MSANKYRVDLAAARLGGVVIAANDDFFAPKESLIRQAAPIWIEDRYTDRGKWMDGWETRRRRSPGHDWCIVRLGLPGILEEAIVDTSHFRGNHPEACSIDACAVAGDPTCETAWTTVLGKTMLAGDSQNDVALTGEVRATHVRLNIFPDGGVARLRIFGRVSADWPSILAAGLPIDLAAVEHEGAITDCSDQFFSSPQPLLLPGPARNMADGWETRRRRGPGHDWVIVRLGRPGRIVRVGIDTTHFKGNAPGSCSLEAQLKDGTWREILRKTELQPDVRHTFEDELVDVDGISHVRLNIYPDGGVARLRVFGWPATDL
jgi:allantoicase